MIDHDETFPYIYIHPHLENGAIFEAFQTKLNTLNASLKRKVRHTVYLRTEPFHSIFILKSSTLFVSNENQ